MVNIKYIIIIVAILGALYMNNIMNNIKPDDAPPIDTKYPEKSGCVPYDNITRNQVIYAKLKKIFNTISNKEHINLEDGDNVLYIPGSIDDYVKREITDITNAILSEIREKFAIKFTLVDFDNINRRVDNDGNIQYKYEVFIQSTAEWLQIRVLIDVVKFVESQKNNINTNKSPSCTSITLPQFKNFPGGIPQPEQMIPLPTQLITTGFPDIIGNGGITRRDVEPASYIYVNSISIFNSSLVINPYTKCPYNDVCGLFDINISHSRFNGPSGPYQTPAVESNRWPVVPESIGKIEWNSRRFAEKWDTRGIYTCVEPAQGESTGIQSSVEKYPAQPNFWPTLPTIPRNSGPNSWLFSLVRGDPATEGADFTQSY